MPSQFGDTNSLASGGGGRRPRKPNLIADKTTASASNKGSLNRSLDEGDHELLKSSNKGGNGSVSDSRRPNQQHYLNETVTSVARKKSTEDLLHDRQHTEFYGSRSDASVVSSEYGGGKSYGSIRGGASEVSKASGRMSRKKPNLSIGKAVGATPETASRRYTSSASAYSETRKQKLTLDQNIIAAVQVAASGGGEDDREFDVVSLSSVRDLQGGPLSGSVRRKKKKKKKQLFFYHRDPDCCVKVSVRVRPEEDDVPKCIEIRKFTTSWEDDDDSEIDDDAFVYNGIRIYDAFNEDDNKEQEFNFDHVFDSNVAHDEIYASSVAPLVESSCCQGFNSTVLAYGETGTGKTFTLLGNAHHNPKNATTKPGSPKMASPPPKAVSSAISCASSVASSLASVTTYGDHSGGAGSVGGGLIPEVAIVPRALYSIFRLLEGMKQAISSDTCEFHYTVRVQFLEVYNNDVLDLLAGAQTSNIKSSKSPMDKNAKSKSKVSLRWAGPDPPQIVGAMQPVVNSAEEGWHFLRQGRKRRHTARTDKNITSSRSHAIFTILIDQRTTFKTVDDAQGDQQNVVTAGQETRSKLNFVDLAAPQRNTSEMKVVDPARFKEQCDINQSLLTLRIVIRAIVEQQEHVKQVASKKLQGTAVTPFQKRIPYRDSKLTSILQGSLGGDHKVVMIACISPDANNVDHSWECLKYMDQIQHIENKPTSHIDHFSQASFYSREKQHQNRDDASGSVRSCNSTIQTRLTYNSAKQNYEIPTRQPMLGLAASQQEGSKFLTPNRAIAHTRKSSACSSPSSIASSSRLASHSKDTNSESSRRTKGSERRYLTDTSSDDVDNDAGRSSDDWDATLDDLLAEGSFDPDRPQVVVTPSPVTKKQQMEIRTASTVDETPMKDFELSFHTGTPGNFVNSIAQQSTIVSPSESTIQKSAKRNLGSVPSTQTLDSRISPHTNDDFKSLVVNRDLDKVLEGSSEHTSSHTELLGEKLIADSYDTPHSTTDVATTSQLDEKFKELSADSVKILPIKAPLSSRGSSSPRKSALSTPTKSKIPTPTRKSTAMNRAQGAANKEAVAGQKVARRLDLSKSFQSDTSDIDTIQAGTVSYVSMLGSKSNSPRNTSYSTSASAISYLFADDNSSCQSSNVKLSFDSDSVNAALHDGKLSRSFPSNPSIQDSILQKDTPTLIEERHDVKNLGIIDNDRLFNLIGCIILDDDPPTSTSFQNLKAVIRKAFENRKSHDTIANMNFIRNSIYDASEEDSDLYVCLQNISSRPQSDEDYQMAQLIGYWICHNQNGDAKPLIDNKIVARGEQVIPLISSLFSHQLNPSEDGDVKSQMKQLLSDECIDGVVERDLTSEIVTFDKPIDVAISHVDADDTRSARSETSSKYKDSDVLDLIGQWMLKKKREEKSHLMDKTSQVEHQVNSTSLPLSETDESSCDFLPVQCNNKNGEESSTPLPLAIDKVEEASRNTTVKEVMVKSSTEHEVHAPVEMFNNKPDAGGNSVNSTEVNPTTSKLSNETVETIDQVETLVKQRNEHLHQDDNTSALSENQDSGESNNSKSNDYMTNMKDSFSNEETITKTDEIERKPTMDEGKLEGDLDTTAQNFRVTSSALEKDSKSDMGDSITTDDIVSITESDHFGSKRSNRSTADVTLFEQPNSHPGRNVSSTSDAVAEHGPNETTTTDSSVVTKLQDTAALNNARLYDIVEREEANADSGMAFDSAVLIISDKEDGTMKVLDESHRTPNAVDKLQHHLDETEDKTILDVHNTKSGEHTESFSESRDTFAEPSIFDTRSPNESAVKIEPVPALMTFSSMANSIESSNTDSKNDYSEVFGTGHTVGIELADSTNYGHVQVDQEDPSSLAVVSVELHVADQNQSLNDTTTEISSIGQRLHDIPASNEGESNGESLENHPSDDSLFANIATVGVNSIGKQSSFRSSESIETVSEHRDAVTTYTSIQDNFSKQFFEPEVLDISQKVNGSTTKDSEQVLSESIVMESDNPKSSPLLPLVHALHQKEGTNQLQTETKTKTNRTETSLQAPFESTPSSNSLERKEGERTRESEGSTILHESTLPHSDSHSLNKASDAIDPNYDDETLPKTKFSMASGEETSIEIHHVSIDGNFEQPKSSNDAAEHLVPSHNEDVENLLLKNEGFARNLQATPPHESCEEDNDKLDERNTSEHLFEANFESAFLDHGIAHDEISNSAEANDVVSCSDYSHEDDPIRLMTAKEKPKVNLFIRDNSTISNGSPVEGNKRMSSSDSSDDLLAEPELDHDCSHGHVLKGKLENVSVLYGDAASTSDSSEIHAMLSEFDKAVEDEGIQRTGSRSGTRYEQSVYESIEEKLRLGQELTEEELTLLEIMLETQPGDVSSKAPPIESKIPLDVTTVKSVPLTVRKEKNGGTDTAKLNEDNIANAVFETSFLAEPTEIKDDNTLSRIEIEAERQRQEEYAEAIARTCCSVTCLGRTIEAYYYDYGFQGDPAISSTQYSNLERPVAKKRRSWMSRVMGFNDSSMTKLPPPEVTGILPEESRNGKATRRGSALETGLR